MMEPIPTNGIGVPLIAKIDGFKVEDIDVNRDMSFDKWWVAPKWNIQVDGDIPKVDEEDKHMDKETNKALSLDVERSYCNCSTIRVSVGVVEDNSFDNVVDVVW